jgi:hypothetical protein
MMAEKERLEKELAEKNRTNGRMSPQQHTAFVRDAEQKSSEEEVYLDLDETEFDVIGHQEPLSDSRVHETTTTPRDEKPIDSADQPVDRYAEKQVTNGEQNVHLEILRELRERIVRDFTLVADVVFPKAIRGPVKTILRSAGNVAKQMAMDLYEFVKRHVKAFMEKRQNRDESSTNNDNKQATGASALSNGRRDYTA